MRATQQYLPLVLFIMPYKVVLTFEFVDDSWSQVRATEQYFPVILFIMLYKVILPGPPKVNFWKMPVRKTI